MRLPSFHWWRTVFYLIPLIAVYSSVLGAISITSSLWDRRGDLAHRCARMWSWLILATTGVRVGCVGRDRLDLTRSYVFVSNHQSFYDIPVIFAALPMQLRIVAKDSLGSFPIWGWHLRRTGHVLVNRKHPGSHTLKRVAALIGSGVSLLVFPEGTRSPDGSVGRFRGGIFFLAIQAGIPIVPLTVVGTRSVMPKGQLTTCPGAATLVVHPVIETAGRSPDQSKALAEEVRAVVASAMTVPETAPPAPLHLLLE